MRKGRIVGRYKISFYEGLTLQRNPASSLLSLCPHSHSLSGPLTQATLFLAHPLFSHPCCLPGSSILSHLSVPSIPQSRGLRDFPKDSSVCWGPGRVSWMGCPISFQIPDSAPGPGSQFKATCASSARVFVSCVLVAQLCLNV